MDDWDFFTFPDYPQGGQHGGELGAGVEQHYRFGGLCSLSGRFFFFFKFSLNCDYKDCHALPSRSFWQTTLEPSFTPIIFYSPLQEGIWYNFCATGELHFWSDYSHSLDITLTFPQFIIPCLEKVGCIQTVHTHLKTSPLKVSLFSHHNKDESAMVTTGDKHKSKYLDGYHLQPAGHREDKHPRVEIQGSALQRLPHCVGKSITIWISNISLSIFFLTWLTWAINVSTFTFLKFLALAQIDPGWSELSMFALRELHFTRLSLLQVAKRQKTKDNEKQKDKMFALKELHFTRLSLLKVANVNIFVVHPTISSHFQASMFYFFSRRNKGQDVWVLRSTVWKIVTVLKSWRRLRNRRKSYLLPMNNAERKEMFFN